MNRALLFALLFAVLDSSSQAASSFRTRQASLSRRFLPDSKQTGPELTEEDSACLLGDWKVKASNTQKTIHFFSPDVARAALIKQVTSGGTANLEQAFQAGAAPGDSEDLAGTHLVIGHIDLASGYFYGMASAIVSREILGAHQAIGHITKTQDGLKFTGNVLAHDGNPLIPISGTVSPEGDLHLHWSSLYSGPVDPATGTAPPSIDVDSTYQASAVMEKSTSSVTDLFTQAVKGGLL